MELEDIQASRGSRAPQQQTFLDLPIGDQGQEWPFNSRRAIANDRRKLAPGQHKFIFLCDPDLVASRGVQIAPPAAGACHE